MVAERSLRSFDDVREVETLQLVPLRSVSPAYDGQSYEDMEGYLVELLARRKVSVQFITVPNGYLCVRPGLDGVVLDSEGRALHETTYFAEGLERLNDFESMKKTAIPLGGPVFSAVDTAWWRSYYHWLCIGLAKIGIADTFLPDQDQIVLPDFEASRSQPARFSQQVWQRSQVTLNLSHPVRLLSPGIYHAPEIRLLWTDYGQVDWISLAPSFYSRFAAARDRAVRTRPRSFVVLRRDRLDPRLPPETVDLVLEAAEAHDLEVLYLEDMGFEAQVELFANAERIVAPHGASLSNMVFSRPGTRILELTHDQEGRGALRHQFCLLADGGGQEFRYLNGTKGDWSRDRLNEALERMR